MTSKVAFLEALDVSRETLGLLDEYVALLEKWNASINLISTSTMPQIWTRHMLDSATAFQQMSATPGLWLDMGSGAGFPGIVLAILAKGANVQATSTLIESDKRKSSFLRTVARKLGLKTIVENARIEDIPNKKAEVITARALAGLPKLFEYCARHLSPDGIAFLHKGEGWMSEIQQAERSWQFQFEAIPSLSSSKSVVLKVGDLRRV